MHIIIIKSFTEKVIPRGNHIFVKDFKDSRKATINNKLSYLGSYPVTNHQTLAVIIKELKKGQKAVNIP